MNQPRHPNGHDPLLQRYHEANALDPARPDPVLRERVLARAREQAALNARLPAAPPRPEAANDRVWTLRALGSLAVLGLVGLLALQFDRSPPEEREVALGTAPVRVPMDAPEAAPAAPAVAPAMAPPADASVASSEAPPAPPPVAKAAPPATNDRARQQPPSPPTPAPAASAPPAPSADVAAETPPAEAATGRVEAPASLSEAAPPAAAQAPAAAETSTPTPMMRSRPAARMAAPMTTPVDPSSETDALGRTPLMLAAARGDTALVERLLAAGADRSQTDHRGWTAADHARHAGHQALAQRLAPPVPPASDGPR